MMIVMHSRRCGKTFALAVASWLAARCGHQIVDSMELGRIKTQIETMQKELDQRMVKKIFSKGNR